MGLNRGSSTGKGGGMRVRSLSVIALAVAVGCTDDPMSILPSVRDGGVRDAAPVDMGTADSGTPDSGTPDSGEAPFELTVYDNGRPLSFLDVVINGPDGTFSHFDQTPLNGTLSADIVPDSMVSVLFRGRMPNGQENFTTFTYVGVQPGDELHLGARTMITPPNNDELSTAQVTFPAPPAEAVRMVVDLGCESAGTSTDSVMLTVPIRGTCLTSRDTMHAFALALRQDGRAVGYTSVTDINPTRSGTTAIVLPAWRFDTDTFTANLTNPRPSALWASVEADLIRDGLEYDGAQFGAGLNAAGVTIEVPLPKNFADGLKYQASVAYGVGMRADSVSLYGATDSRMVASSADVDITADTPPPIYGVAIDRADPERPTLRFRVDGDATTAADGMIFQLPFTDANGEHSWTVAAPPDHPAEFRFPELPERFAAYRPSAGAMIENSQVYLLGTSEIDDWDEFRQSYGPAVFLLTQQFGDVIFTVSIGGRLGF